MMDKVRQRILIVEDEPGLVMTLTDRLESEGYEVESVTDGEAALARAMKNAYDLIILDIMLPARSGLEVCRALRRGGIETPVLMLTARGQLADKVVGLQVGGDDYLTKPFEMMELLARVEALLRRAARHAPVGPGSCRFGSIQADFRRAEVLRDGKPVTLSAREFQLLRYLVEHRGEVISRERLLAEVWGYAASVSTRTVDVHVTWLRQKLEPNPKFPEHIQTVRGLGYRFSG